MADSSVPTTSTSAWADNALKITSGTGSYGSVYVRHNKKANALYGDGHVAQISKEEIQAGTVYAINGVGTVVYYRNVASFINEFGLGENI